MQKRKTPVILALSLLAVLCVAAAAPLASVYAANPTGAWVSNDFNEQDFTVYAGFVVFNGYLNMIPGVDHTCKLESANAFDTMQSTNYTAPQGAVYCYLNFNVSWAPAVGNNFQLDMISTGAAYTYLNIIHNSDGTYKLEVKAGSPQKVNDSATFTTVPNQVILCYTGTWFVLYDTGLNVVASVECSNSQSLIWTNYEFQTYFANGAQIYGYSFASTLNAIQQNSTIDIHGMSSTVMAFVPIIILFAMLGMLMGLIKKFTKD